MVALAHGGQVARPRLRLVTDDELQRRRRQELAMLRRRVVAMALVVGMLLALGLALRRAAEGGGMVVRGGAEVAMPIAQRAYVVQPGDTLWEIARALQPEGDVRPLVQALGRARHGAPLQVGERITVP